MCYKHLSICGLYFHILVVSFDEKKLKILMCQSYQLFIGLSPQFCQSQNNNLILIKLDLRKKSVPFPKIGSRYIGIQFVIFKFHVSILYIILYYDIQNITFLKEKKIPYPKVIIHFSILLPKFLKVLF